MNTERSELEGFNPEESDSNPELDALLSEATKTKQEEVQEEREEKASNVMTDEKAAEIASAGLFGAVGLANEFGGMKIVLPEKTAVVAISLFCPLVKKYGSKIKLDPKGVNLDSWMPELLALGGVGVVGFTINRQLNEKPVNDAEGAESGDQSEHG